MQTRTVALKVISAFLILSFAFNSPYVFSAEISNSEPLALTPTVDPNQSNSNPDLSNHLASGSGSESSSDGNVITPTDQPEQISSVSLNDQIAAANKEALELMKKMVAEKDAAKKVLISKDLAAKRAQVAGLNKQLNQQNNVPDAFAAPATGTVITLGSLSIGAGEVVTAESLIALKAPEVAPINEDTSRTIYLGSTSESNGLTYSIVSNPAHGTLVKNSEDVSGKTYSYTPAANYSGPDSFIYKVNNGSTEVTQTLSLNINAINDAPTITSLSLQLINSRDTRVLPFTIGDVDGNSNLTVTATSRNPALISNEGGIILGGSGNNRTIQISPNPNFFNSDNSIDALAGIVLTVSDGVTSTTSFLNVNVNRFNPIALEPVAPYNIEEDSSYSRFELRGSDQDASFGGSFLNYNILTNPAHGSLVRYSSDPSGRTYNYIPDANYSGPDSFTFDVSNAGAHSAPRTVEFNVVARNDAPTITTPNSSHVMNARDISVLPFTIGDVDANSNLTVTATSSDPSVISNQGGIVLGGSGNNRTIQLSPNVANSGFANITLTVSDGIVSRSTSFIVVVDPANFVPVALEPVVPYVIEEDSSDARFELRGSDQDPGTVLSYVIVTNPVHGSLVRASYDPSGRTYLYTPNANYSGPDSFTFNVSDRTSVSAPRTVEFNVRATNVSASAAQQPSSPPPVVFSTAKASIESASANALTKRKLIFDNSQLKKKQIVKAKKNK